MLYILRNLNCKQENSNNKLNTLCSSLNRSELILFNSAEN